MTIMSNHCEHQYDDLNVDEFIGDECEKNLLEASNGCIRCRKLSTSSSILSYEGKMPLWTDESRNTLIMEEHHGNATIPTVMFPQARVSVNSTDNFEIPLLDRYSNVPLQNGHVHNIQEHCHSQMPHRKSSGPWRQLMAASIMCLIFMLAEVIGGYLAGSLAVMTDAAHLLSDFVGFLVSLFAIWVGQRPPTKKLSFGYYRAEILGALLSIVIIWMLTGIFVYLAVLRLLHGDFEIDANTMMAVSGIGVVINIIMGLTLHGVCTSLSHGHSHGLSRSTHSHLASEQCPSNVPGNINMRAAVIHVVGDLVQSIGVFVAAIIIKIYPNAKLADPICTFVFSLIVLFTTVSVLRDTINVLMEGFPSHFNYTSVVQSLCRIEGVQSAHSLHIWSLTLDKYALAVHLAINNAVDPDVVLRRALKFIRSKLNIEVATVQVERYLSPAMEDCIQCRPPID